MASGVHTRIVKCESCARNRSSYRHKRPLQRFPASKPLNFIAIVILGPLSKTKQSNHYICVVTDQYSRLAQAIFMSETSSTNMASLFLDYWMVPFGVLTYLLTDNAPWSVDKLLTLVSWYLGVKNLTTTAYCPQIEGKTERSNLCIATRLWQYVAKHQ